MLLNTTKARQAFEGKTIERIDARAVNIIRFYFTDGTAAAIEIEGMGHGISGMVFCPTCITPPKERKDASYRQGR